MIDGEPTEDGRTMNGWPEHADGVPARHPVGYWFTPCYGGIRALCARLCVAADPDAVPYIESSDTPVGTWW